MAERAYTPDTATVRDCYVGTGDDYDGFDRWLAAHDAGVRATAFEEAERMVPDLYNVTKLRLLNRAADIREEARRG